MVEVYQRVHVGTEADCISAKEGWSVVHACKSPCHQEAVGYRGSLPPTHPHYLVLEKSSDLFLNIIDPPSPLFKLETFSIFLRFAHEHWTRGQHVLIHCNQGESRAPTLAMLLMSKRLKLLPSASYQEAASSFMALYPRYKPGRGLQRFLSHNWNNIR